MIDLVGQKYGRWFVVERDVDSKYSFYFICKCECGNVKSVNGYSLVDGCNKSCGCLKKQRAVETHTKHGCSKVGEMTGEYRSYHAMKGRCYNGNTKQYYDYGGRGIVVCERWLGKDGFSNFLSDMGKKPSSKHTIERRKNNENYSPDNCFWATPIEQGRNKRNSKWVEGGGEKLIVSEWARRLCVTPATIDYHLKTKSIEQIINFYDKKRK